MAAELREEPESLPLLQGRYVAALERWRDADRDTAPEEEAAARAALVAAERRLRIAMTAGERRAYDVRVAAYRAHRPAVAAGFWRGMAAVALAVVFGLCLLTLLAQAIAGTEVHGWGVAALVVGCLSVFGLLALEAPR